MAKRFGRRYLIGRIQDGKLPFVHEYLERVDDFNDLHHPDRNVQNHLTQLSDNANLVRKQKQNRNTGNSLFGRTTGDIRSAPGIYSAITDAIIGSYGRFKGSKNITCPICGDDVPASKTKNIPWNTEPYSKNVCETHPDDWRGSDEDWNPERDPFGAARRNRMR